VLINEGDLPRLDSLSLVFLPNYQIPSIQFPSLSSAKSQLIQLERLSQYGDICWCDIADDYVLYLNAGNAQSNIMSLIQDGDC